MLFIIVVKLFLFVLVQSDTNHLQVKTNSGWVQGSIDVSYYKRHYLKFTGIPFAQPPVGRLRFEPPKPPSPWSGIYKATNLTTCLQLAHIPMIPGGAVTGLEDCLHLNVFVPRTNTSQLKDLHLDVIVHIHGGSFSYSMGGNSRPDFIMDREVILVTFNYRVGVFGFFSTESAAYPGNMALRDQIMALHWVKNNIKHFGGNPKSVSITGMSSGAGSVQYLTVSPLAKGLFHKAHSMSGSALRLMQINPWKKARRLGRMLGCNFNNKQRLGKCLKKIPAAKIVEAQRAFRYWLYTPIAPFAAVVDKWSDKPVIPEHPIRLFAKKQVIDVPFINSFCADEGLYPAAEFIYKDSYLPELNENWCELSSSILSLRGIVPKAQLCNISEIIREFYFQDKNISFKTMPEVIKMVGARLYLADIDIGVRMHSSAIKSPVYSYKYDYLQDMPDYAMFLSNKTFKLGVSHGNDLFMILPFLSYTKRTLTTRDEKMMNYLLDIWIELARYGRLLNWIPVSKNIKDPINLKHLKETQQNDLKVKELGDRHFWDKLKIRQTS